MTKPIPKGDQDQTTYEETASSRRVSVVLKDGTLVDDLNPFPVKIMGTGSAAIDITSFTNNVGNRERGEVINDATFNWVLNLPGTETDQTIGAPGFPIEHITPGTYQKIYGSMGLTSSTTWTLWVTDGSSQDTAPSSINFYNRRYWGSSANPGPLTDPEILAFSSELATARQCTKTYDCTGGKYIWFCYPSSWGLATFWVNGFPTTFLLTVQNFTNQYGYTESYNTYRSLLLQQGSGIIVEVR